MADIGYIISSHINYNEPLQVLLDSMRDIPSERITVVRGGCEYRNTFYDEESNICFIDVPHNSFDYNGLIDFVEYQWDAGASHILCLHDTMEFGPHADDLLSNINEDLWATAVFGGQCNLVTYRADYLLANMDRLISWKNCSKAEAIAYEGLMFRLCPPEHRGSYNSACLEMGVHRPYGGADRIKEYYNAVDITKYKANWGQSSRRFVTQP